MQRCNNGGAVSFGNAQAIFLFHEDQGRSGNRPDRRSKLTQMLSRCGSERVCMMSAAVRFELCSVALTAGRTADKIGGLHCGHAWCRIGR